MIERHLLLVDDEPNVLSALQRCLRHEGYIIHLAKSASEALACLEENSILVVVSDQRMPVMTGAELLAKVKERWPHTVRLMLSGYSEVTSLVDTINQGAAWKFLFKPWDDDALRARLREAFDLVESQILTRQLTEELRDANLELSRLNDIVVNGYETQVARQQAQIALLKKILESYPLPFVIVQQGVIVYANVEAERGFNREVQGRPVTEIFATDTEQQGWTKISVESDVDSYAFLCGELTP